MINIHNYDVPKFIAAYDHIVEQHHLSKEQGCDSKRNQLRDDISRSIQPTNKEYYKWM